MLLFAFVLMLVAFRSLVIAVKAILLNLLSVAAAYGVLVLVFQHGVGKGLLGFSSTAGIDPVVPLLLFVILFGLSMDYHVFIISRIRERFDRGATMDEAIAHGIKSTAGVVTSAAIVMVGVFAIFATLSMLFFKQFGVGLAAAILIDATIVRGVLLPATMKLLGDWNWYLPRWLDWLPQLEPAAEPGDAGDLEPVRRLAWSRSRSERQPEQERRSLRQPGGRSTGLALIAHRRCSGSGPPRLRHVSSGDDLGSRRCQGRRTDPRRLPVHDREGQLRAQTAARWSCPRTGTRQIRV